MRAFSQNVIAVSSGSGTGATSASAINSIGRLASSGRISRTLFGFVVASRSLAPKDRADDGALLVDQIVNALVGEGEQAVECFRAERLRFGRALDLDEPAVAGLDDVHVDIGLRIFLVREIEQR